MAQKPEGGINTVRSMFPVDGRQPRSMDVNGNGDRQGHRPIFGVDPIYVCIIATLKTLAVTARNLPVISVQLQQKNHIVHILPYATLLQRLGN